MIIAVSVIRSLMLMMMIVLILLLLIENLIVIVSLLLWKMEKIQSFPFIYFQTLIIIIIIVIYIYEKLGVIRVLLKLDHHYSVQLMMFSSLCFVCLILFPYDKNDDNNIFFSFLITAYLDGQYRKSYH